MCLYVNISLYLSRFNLFRITNRNPEIYRYYFIQIVISDRPFYGHAKSLADLFKFNRIIGGQDALIAEFPHQVSLQWGYPPFVAYSHLCGGSIIDQSWILTAAHCVNSLPRSGEFVVRAGKHFIKTDEATEQISLTTEVFIHKNYRG